MSYPNESGAEVGEPRIDAVATAAWLEDLIAQAQARLTALGDALCRHDGQAIENHAAKLKLILASAMDGLAQATRRGQVPHALGRRLAEASGQLTAQREALARSTAALGCLLDVLLPRPVSSGYSAQGHAQRQRNSGSLLA